MKVHQSQLSAWARCPQAMFLEHSGNPTIQTSALSYGTVLHYAVEVFEREWRAGNTFRAAQQIAVDTFRHYWHPLNIASVAAPVQLWLRGQSYGGMLESGTEALLWYTTWSKEQDEKLLATEYSFHVPIPGTWDDTEEQPHILVGTIDRLSLRHLRGKPYLQVGDIKSGKDYPYLRQNLQFTAYCMASTRKEFWAGWCGEDGFGDLGPGLYEQLKPYARQGLWISLKKHKAMDAGWRGDDDYRRFAIAVEQLVASIRADIYPLSISGENCSYCPHRTICGGTGVPADKHGAPA